MKRHTTGAYMASAAEKRPKRNGPSAPWRSQLCQSDWMRSISSMTSAGQVRGAKTLRTFIDRFWRSAGKPECISAQTDRAVARATDSAGQPRVPGCASARYSRIASESQTRVSPSISTGTFPDCEYLSSRSFESAWYKGMQTSSKAIAFCFMNNHGRSDQEE